MEFFSLSKIIMPVLAFCYFARKNYINLFKKANNSNNSMLDISYKCISFLGFLMSIVVILNFFWGNNIVDYFYTICTTAFLYFISELISAYKKSKADSDAYVYIVCLILFLLILFWIVTAD
ncbi:hypothetical protein [Veillonella caviae]|uniref:hypothetical protein n=1 Tax=Veillonella caviae TaxID=248316 RepID=UPI002A919F03|nr:hypothetical protein [Veillonella caviae]